MPDKPESFVHFGLFAFARIINRSPIVLYTLRQLLSILILPATVTVFVPVWIARTRSVAFDAPVSLLHWLPAGAGCAAFVVGAALFLASLANFWRHGRGTLAPWDPPRRLVVRGPYCYVRNPMISGVIFILCGEALVTRSPALGVWALLFTLINVVYIPAVEEPQLQDRFGQEYREYCRQVRRFVPRLRPWAPRAAATRD